MRQEEVVMLNEVRLGKVVMLNEVRRGGARSGEVGFHL